MFRAQNLLLSAPVEELVPIGSVVCARITIAVAVGSKEAKELMSDGAYSVRTAFAHSSSLLVGHAMICLSMLSSSFLAAAPDGDPLRLSSALGSSGLIEIVASVLDCRDVTSVQLVAQAQSVELSPLDANQSSDSAVGCEFTVISGNSLAIDSSVTVSLSDGSDVIHTEDFLAETLRPKVSLESVSLQQTDDGQFLVSGIYVSVDTDISYLDVSFLAIRVSDIRESVGIVEGTKNSAFASTNGTTRVWPELDTQNEFYITLPVDGELSEDEILRNGVVLIDATAVDSSGNAALFGRLRS